MTLAELQHDFRSWLVSASTDSATRLGPMAGLSVYQNNYRTQLVNCLEQSYPLLRQFIGEKAFLDAAITHIDTHPPSAWTLDAYADGFLATLQQRYPDNPDAHELAWIEWALATAFVAPDCAPLSAVQAATLDWDSAKLQLVPSFACIDAATNAEQIWRALWEEKNAPDGEMLAEPGALIVWRRGFTSSLRFVSAFERDALLQLRADPGFNGLCAMLIARLGESEGVIQAGALLASWLGSGLIAARDNSTIERTTP